MPGGTISLAWRKAGGTLRYTSAVPAGYRVEVENRSGLTLAKE